MLRMVSARVAESRAAGLGGAAVSRVVRAISVSGVPRAFAESAPERERDEESESPAHTCQSVARTSSAARKLTDLEMGTGSDMNGAMGPIRSATLRAVDHFDKMNCADRCCGATWPSSAPSVPSAWCDSSCPDSLSWPGAGCRTSARRRIAALSGLRQDS